jgi:hypothetical protein
MEIFVHEKRKYNINLQILDDMSCKINDMSCNKEKRITFFWPNLYIGLNILDQTDTDDRRFSYNVAYNTYIWSIIIVTVS